MKLSVNQFAPSFSTTDVYGTPIDLKKWPGRKIYLAFERNAGCPVCNLHFHEFLKHSDYFTRNEITVILVYESAVSKMKEYLGKNKYPFHFVSDPDNTFYDHFGVEQSIFKLLRSPFNGLFDKVTRGTKLFTRPMKQDGTMTRIPAEFIIDGNGKIELAHYGAFIGDHKHMEELKRHL
jgi:peroxiredoxin Q/BCP